MKPTVFCALLLACVAGCSGERTAASDSAAATDSIRAISDSLALDMARELGVPSSRSGTFAVGDTIVEWTARMQGEAPILIEERMRVLEREAATRVYFLTPEGTLEQYSEQMTRRTPAGDRQSETRIEFTATPPLVSHTVNGTVQSASDVPVDRIVKRAQLMLTTARNTTAAGDSAR